MKCVIQRVKSASIVINGKFGGEIGAGLVVFAAYCDTDDEAVINFCVEKTANLRIFDDGDGKLNNSVLDVGGSILLVSNFTLYGDTQKGRRPSFVKSSKPEISMPLYEKTVRKFKELFPDTVCGEFGADMQISLVNDGPVTIIVEKENV